ncbi:MAG: hypothetical protein P4M15_01810 [Alphaproteobacteria bacterium]|nr:hypothetical protein [Alphaproteobacteria bacterium]
MLDRPTFDVVVSRIEQLAPRNWDELADAAKFVKVGYADMVEQNANNLFERVYPSALAEKFLGEVEAHFATLNPLGVKIIAKAFNTNKNSFEDATNIYLGAKAAAIEDQPIGDFATKPGLPLIAEAASTAGLLIMSFVDASRLLLKSQIMMENEKVSEDFIRGTKQLESRAFDTSVSIMALLEAENNPLRPQTDTIISLVKSEIGYLPEPTIQKIRNTVSFRQLKN